MFEASVARVGRLRGLGRVACGLANDLVAVSLLGLALDADDFVAGHDNEERRVAPHPLVLLGQDRDPLRAADVNALADDLERSGVVRERAIELLQALVDLAEHGLVQAELALLLRHTVRAYSADCGGTNSPPPRASLSAT